MNLHSKCFRVVGLTAIICVTCLAAVGQTAASPNSKSNPPRVHGPALRTEKGNYSFRGLQVPVGQTSSPIEIPVANGGDVPLTGVSAVTHGDFVVTGTTCSAQLPAGKTEKSRCVISVAFHPTASGPKTGDLTIAANGADSMVVPLDAGIPVDFGSVPMGEVSVVNVWLHPQGPLTGSVTGPFAMALQAPYTYGSIDGINFAPSSSGAPLYGALALLLQFKPIALGTQTGTVTLSDGTTYALTANVPDGVQLSPPSVDFQETLFGTVSGTAPFVLTNGSKAALTISSVQANAPFAAVNHCGTSLAAGASCTIGVNYSPTASGGATGQLTVSTSSGDFVASLAGVTWNNYVDAWINPVNLFLTFTRIGDLSPQQTITVRNLNSKVSLGIRGFEDWGICSATLTSDCYQINSNNCSTLAPLATCQIQVQYVFGAPSGITQIILAVDRGNAIGAYSIYTHVAAPAFNGDPGSVITMPSPLIFPPTPIGQASDEQLVTVANNSTQPSVVGAEASYEFTADTGCLVLNPGDSCLVHVRFTPVRAGVHEGSAGGVGVEGYGIPSDAALATPSYPSGPLLPTEVHPAGYVPDGTYIYDSLPVKNTGTTPLVIANAYLSRTTFSPESAAPFFSLDPSQCADPLAPGAECTLNLTFNPEGCPPVWQMPIPGPCYNETYLYLESNAQSSVDTYQFEGLHVESTTTSPDLPGSAFPFGIQFGRVQIGNSVTQTLASGPFVGISMSGSSAFQLVNGCASPGGSTNAPCTAQVAYAPTAPGFSFGSVKIVTTTAIVTVTLSGFAIPAQVTATPIVFPNTLVYQNPPNQTGTVTNTTDAPLALGTILGPGFWVNLVGTTCGSSLAAHATCTMTVSFTPGNNVGNQGSRIAFSFGVDDGVETIPIYATVTSLTITPASADFGSINTGQMAAQTFTVQNIGDPVQLYGTATLQGASLTGTNASDFSITANTCAAGTTLTGAQTCNVTVQFKPAVSGIRNAVLTITTANAGYTSAILAGTGNAPSTGCDQRHLHHHDKDDHGERDCDCDEHDHRDRHECRTREHRDNDHEQREK